LTSVKVVKNAYLIDGTGKSPVKNARIVIEDKWIKAVGTDVDVPGGAEVIDVKGKTVMPGLIDLHIHPTSSIDPTDPKNLALARHWSNELQLISAVKNLEDQLKTGVTTVRCMGVSCALRQAVEKGIFSGPRILVAGPFERGVPSTGPVERRKWVRGKIEENVDFIKILSTGGVTHDGAEGMVGGVRLGPEALKGTVEEHRAVVEEAHDVGLTVAVHAEGLEGIKRAVEAGVDTIEHGMWLDDETAEKMAEKGIFFVPTLTIQRMLAEKGPVLGYVPASWSETCKIAWPEKVTSALKSARKAGVKIACGTDGGDTKKMLCAEELELLVSMAGMTEMEAIVAATKTSAEAVKRGKFIGTIEKGKHADILVVDGDPLKDIKVLQNREKIRMVMKDGKVEVDRGL